MWTVQDEKKHADSSAKNVQALAEQARAKFPDSDWTARAETIAYRVQQGIPVFGSDRE